MQECREGKVRRGRLFLVQQHAIDPDPMAEPGHSIGMSSCCPRAQLAGSCGSRRRSRSSASLRRCRSKA